MPRTPQETEQKLLAMANAEPESPEPRGQLGLLYISTGRVAEALVEFRAAFSLDPADPVGRYNYAAALHAAGDDAQSLEVLDDGLRDSPGDAALHYGRGCSLQSLERHAEAKAAHQQAVKLEPRLTDAWYALGTMEHAAGRHATAIECYQKVVALQPEHPSALHMLDALIGHESKQPPGDFAKVLFDSYADYFDEHLTGKLEYRGPELVEQALRAQLETRSGLRVLDLGCGTGLFGERIRPLASELVGIDVSSKMVDKARGRDCYDSLEVAELTDYLQRVEPGKFDVISAVDVFIYLGSLEKVVSACTTALARNGMLAFTTETGERDFTLDRTGRYTHSPGYLEDLREQAGFELLSMSEETVRTESNEPCRALVNVWKVCSPGRTGP